ncbi:LTA synthase family protein [Limnovirga soli]|uniref:Sulfatase-like hydrolase/transferase n=1 Tax=Limnovirga soli TaxID=2656915 RepID=A0A8J8FGB6_9BACT|nr:LTA synthase family protein [Limnovirga soli]NNV55859.1 sulfatase-like hydrolase/transferase [Limnovirga soli]
MKEVITTKPTFISKFKNSLIAFSGISMVWLLLLLLLSMYEIVLNTVNNDLNNEAFYVIVASIFNATLFWLKCYSVLYLIFVFVHYFSSRLAYTIISICLILLTIGQISLIKYFNTAFVPLGADLFGYSAADIQQTVGASGSLNFTYILTVLIAIALVIIGLKKAKHRFSLSFKPALFLLLISLLYVFSNIRPTPFQSILKTEFTKNLSVNKDDYFLSTTFQHFFTSADEDAAIFAQSYTGGYFASESENGKFSYVDEENYPFLHKETTSDVLSPFINKGETPPNIVIILVEGLGRAFANDGAYLGNFTPFLDSLSNQSLYWKNFVSQGGRTFAVLPSILGSLPFAKNGFNELGNNMPNHLSLISLLKLNGYNSAFYYGGDAHFDNMSLFLQKNGIGAVNDEATFPKTYAKMPASSEGFTWGYGDENLFKRYMELHDNANNTKPNLDILLTVSMHSPFLINNPDTYYKLFEQRLKQQQFSDQEMDNYRKYKAQYASIMYTDKALQQFFSAYKTKKEYNNTIFVITGDHRMPEIPISSKIDRYHVPLIIYSPLLKRTATFSSISAHVDITPSLLAFLHSNYNFKQPTLTSWLGTGLDTSRQFANNHQYALMQTKNDLLDYIEGNFHLNEGNLFSLSENMNESASTNAENQNKLQTDFSLFKSKNNKITNGAKLIPDSIYNTYFPH